MKYPANTATAAITKSRRILEYLNMVVSSLAKLKLELELLPPSPDVLFMVSVCPEEPLTPDLCDSSFLSDFSLPSSSAVVVA